MDKKPSEYIDGFLTFLREAWSEHYMAKGTETDTDKETQDILHWLEFHVGPDMDICDLLNVAIELGAVRQRRRKAKDTAMVTEPVIDWISKNEPVRKNLERLLGEVRKAEKRTQNRHYMEKTNILTEIFESPKEPAVDEQEDDSIGKNGRCETFGSD